MDFTKAVTTRVDPYTHASYVAGNRDTFQVHAQTENIVTDSGHRIGDDDVREFGTTMESMSTDTGYRMGDDSVITSSNQGVGFCFNDRITILSAIIARIVV